MPGKGASRKEKPNAGKVRLDKWLWAARFFKTRSLASDAVKGGKVWVNGQRGKAGRDVDLGDTIELRQGYIQKTVIVRDLSERRGPASVAQDLYEETAESISTRDKEHNMRQLAASQRPRGEGRPTKRERRQLQRLIGD